MLDNMDRWLLWLLAEGDFIGLLCFWGLLLTIPILGPVVTFAGVDGLIKGKRSDLRDNLVFTLGGLAATLASFAAAFTVVRNFRQVVDLTLSAGGALLILIIACAAAFPVGLVGYQLRVAMMAFVKGSPAARRRKEAWYAIGGVTLLSLLAISLHRFGGADIGWFFSVGAAVVVGLGFFGAFFVPVDLD